MFAAASNPVVIDLTNDSAAAAAAVDQAMGQLAIYDEDDDFILDAYLSEEMYGNPAIVFGRDAGACPHCYQCQVRRNVWRGVRDLVDTLDEELEYFLEVRDDSAEVERAMDRFEIAALHEKKFLRAAITDTYDITEGLTSVMYLKGLLVETTEAIRTSFRSLGRALPTLASLAAKREAYHNTLRGELLKLRAKMWAMEDRPLPCSAVDEERIYKANLVVILASHTSALSPDNLRTLVATLAADLDAAIKLLDAVVKADGACVHKFE